MLFASTAAFALTSEPAGPPPPDLAPQLAGMLQKDGVRVLDEKKIVIELWLRTTAPTGPKNTGLAISFTNIPQGSLMGVARFPERGADRRGQQIKPGVYVLRLGFFPPNGDHQGVSPQRDFLILSPAADDKDPNSTPAFDALMNLSRKASGTPHPLVLSTWKSESDWTPGLSEDGDDTVLRTKMGDVPISIIVAGKFDH